jgi:Rnl2 family RNA ligase
MVTFRKYPSIENSYRQKHIDFWFEKHPELISAEYVVQEKIHGCNIQLIFDSEGNISVGSRTQIIPKEDKTSLYGINAYLDNAPGDLVFLMKEMRSNAVFNCRIIRLYGEFFGSNIQKGVDYGKEKKIIFFDMSVDDILLSQFEMETFFLHQGLEKCRFIVPQLCARVRGFNEAVEEANISIKRNSYITQVSENSEQVVNLMEGCVLKPYYFSFVDINGDPFYVKIKNEEFKEKSRESKPESKPSLDPEINELKNMFSTYLTENRLQTVFSKLGEIQKPDQMSQYIKEFMSDAIADFMKDEGDRVEVLSKQDQKIVFNASKIAVEMIKKNL